MHPLYSFMDGYKTTNFGLSCKCRQGGNMNRKIKNLLNKQIIYELETAYLYLEFSYFFNSRNMNGYYDLYRRMAKEEIERAMAIYELLLKTKQSVKLLVIHAPEQNYTSIIDVLEVTLRAKKDLNYRIKKIHDLALKENDFISKTFLQHFMDKYANDGNKAEEMIEDYYEYKNDLQSLNKKYIERVVQVAQ